MKDTINMGSTKAFSKTEPIGSCIRFRIDSQHISLKAVSDMARHQAGQKLAKAAVVGMFGLGDLIKLVVQDN